MRHGKRALLFALILGMPIVLIGATRFPIDVITVSYLSEEVPTKANGWWGNFLAAVLGGPLAACATEIVKGGDYSSDLGLYGWTCGNYNWSALTGGGSAPDWDSATTSGGNSWTMSCTGDGTATGAPEEQVVCLEAGETFKMYAMADIMLAFNATKCGGKVYLPEGNLYHDAGCGQQADGTQNSCPVLSRWPYAYQRNIQAFCGTQIVGSRSQRSDPVIHGRNGTWIVSDHGRGGEWADADTDRSDDTTKLARWAGINSGMGRRERWCRTSTATAPLACELIPETVSGTWGKVGFTSYGRTASLLGTSTINNNSGLCLEDVIATNGVCSGNRLILCTAASGGRTGATTGDCGDFGTCEPYATAIETDLAAGIDIWVSIQIGSCSYGDTGAACNDHNEAVIGRITSVGGTCSTTGRYIEFEDNTYKIYKHWPLPYQTVTWSEHGTGTVSVINMREFNNQGGGFVDLSTMSANWPGRNSSNDDADCEGAVGLCTASGVPWACCTGAGTGTCSSGETAGCDGVELLSLMPSLYGGAERIALWYGGGGRNYGVVDGSTRGIFAQVNDSYFSRLTGFLADTSGWWFTNNTYADNYCGSTACIGSSFSVGFRMENETFIRNVGPTIRIQHARETLIRDITLISNTFSWGFLKIEQGAQILVDGIQGWGNQGPIASIGLDTDYTGWGIEIGSVHLTGHDLKPWWSATPQAAIAVTDYNGAKLGTLKHVSIHDVFIDDGSQYGCLIFLGGGIGDESDSANGSGRTIDDIRHLLSFRNMELSTFNASTPQVWCLGNAASASNAANERLGDIWDSEGGLPYWENLYLNGTKFPDWPHATMATADVPDCETLVYGTVVAIHDAPSAGACTDSDTDGVLDGAASDPDKYVSVCMCDPTGDSGDGTWSAL